MVDEDSPALARWRNYQAPPPVDDVADSDGEDDKDAAPAMAPGMAPAMAPAMAPGTNTGQAFDAHVNHLIERGIKKRTSQEARVSGRKALRAASKEDKKQEPFYDVSVYNELFPGRMHLV